MNEPEFDLLVVGGGVNGTAIARDAAGRGLRVALVEAGDLAQETSSKSTKLFHGGLRYLEYLEIALVKKALAEREILLRQMPFLARDMRFVMPLDPKMRFDLDTPVSKITRLFLPWLAGRRPRWMIRFGLGLYDALAHREILPATRSLNLHHSDLGAPLRSHMRYAYEYSDVAVDDARLVVLLARDAARLGAQIYTYNAVQRIEMAGKLWKVTRTEGADLYARAIVNATGPWVSQLFEMTAPSSDRAIALKLVRGAHIVVRRLFEHDKAYIFQTPGGRVIFAIPFEGGTLIGTTDVLHGEPDVPPICTQEEADYLLSEAGRYFKAILSKEDIITSFAGVRALVDEGGKSAKATTRDYKLDLYKTDKGHPILNIIGGKLTTHRVLAEEALAALYDFFPELDFPKIKQKWTAHSPLPGGDFAYEEKVETFEAFQKYYPFIDAISAQRIFKSYGLDAKSWLGAARTFADLGTDFGHGLTQAEVDYMIYVEWARHVDDVLWRRSKLGIVFSPEEKQRLEHYIKKVKS